MGDVEYDREAIIFLETLWGEGFLSPGGSEEIDRIIQHLDFDGKSVLDIGCGAGGMTCYLAKEKNLSSIIGYDVEQPVIERAKILTKSRKLQGKVEFVLGKPGPLPFPDQQFDIVFSKDALVHVADKESLCKDIFRVLKPGGTFTASDWLTSHDGDPSPKMKNYLAMEGLSFGMASSERYENAMTAAGFIDVKTTDRNRWYLEVAKEELANLKGSLKIAIIEKLGVEYLNKNIATWSAMLEVLETGEHCPTHLYARKPLAQENTS